MPANFDRIKTLLDLQSEFIIKDSEILVLENMHLSYLKHKIIPNLILTMYEIQIDEDYFIKMKDNDMKTYYQEFHKRVFNNLILRVYHLFSEERKPNYFLYIIFERTEFLIIQCFSIKNQVNMIKKHNSFLPESSGIELRPRNESKLSKTTSNILSDKYFNLETEDLLIQVISFYYDVMSLLTFLENKKYYFPYFIHIFNPYFLFITKVESEEKFEFYIKPKYIIKFLILPEPLLRYLYQNTTFVQSPIKVFFQNIKDKLENSFSYDVNVIFPTLKKVISFYNIYVSSKLFLDILKTINNQNLSKQSYNLKLDLIQLLKRSIVHFVIENLEAKETERFSQKHFLNSYYKELKNFLQVYVFSEKIKQIFSKSKSKIYQYVIIKDVTQNHILQKILQNTNPLVKSLHFSDCRIDPEFFKDITVAFRYLEELIIRNLDRSSKCYRLEETQLKSLIYSGKMQNLRILDLAGNSIKLGGPLFINKVESANVREKALPNIIELNLSKNDLKCEDCQKILQEPVFGNVRKINLSENNIAMVFNDENGYCLLSKLESLNFSKNLLNNVGSQKLFASYGLESLKKLELSYNKIMIPVKVSHLINLRVLKLDYNLIDSNGSQSIFSNEYLKNLEELSLVGNSIKFLFLNDTKNQLVNLNKLNLSKNQIADNRAQVIFLKETCFDNLKELDLSNNSIEALLPQKEKMNENLVKKLKFLNLAFNHITDEGSNLLFDTEFESLYDLNLNFNDIWEPVNESYKLYNLIKLNLNDNRISDTGSQRLFEKLPSNSKLRKLDLQSNRLTMPLDPAVIVASELPIENLNLNFNRINCQGSQALFSCEKLVNLVELKLACNKIVVPIKENNLQSLTKLTLANNLVNSLGSNSIFTAKKLDFLQVLDLYKNSIEIPFEGNNCLTELVDLNLTKNKINSKGSNKIFSSESFQKLENLILNENIIEIPCLNNNLTNLQLLNLKSNKVTSEGCQILFQNPNFKNLKKLYIRDNLIEIPIISFKSSLINLYKISLVENKITSEGCQNLLKLSQLDRLEIISLSRNKIEYPIDMSSPSELKHLRRLNLSYNPLKFEGIAPIFQCAGLKNLETIKIMECELTEIIDPKKPFELTRLRFLLAAQNKLNSQACQNIFLCENLKNLQILDLCNNNIEIPLKIKDEIPTKPKLATILLSRNSISSEGAQQLFGCKAFPKLLNLDLSDNSIQHIEKDKFTLVNLAQLTLVENNLDYETNTVVDELNKTMKVVF